MRFVHPLLTLTAALILTSYVQVHHILSEIIQGGLVLETNVEEIDNAGQCIENPNAVVGREPDVASIYSARCCESKERLVHIIQSALTGSWRRRLAWDEHPNAAGMAHWETYRRRRTVVRQHHRHRLYIGHRHVKFVL